MKIGAFCVLLFLTMTSFAQDPQFSQFFASPLYINPAFTGNTVEHRFVMNYRNQWPELKSAFVTYNASYDLFIPSANSGVGLQLTHDRAGIGALQYTAASGFYAYQFQVSREWVIKSGLSFSGYRRAVDPTKFVFADQIARGQGRSTVEFIQSDPKLYFDFSSGMLAYNRSAWFGFAVHHINEPNQSLLGEQNAPLPAKYSLHGGYRFVLREGPMDRIERALWFAFNAKRQNVSTQLDVGAYCEFFPVIFGVWYRGLPIGQGEPYYQNRDAVVVMAGAELAEFRFAYSYDITVSNLFGNVGGAHEFSLIFEFEDNSQSKPKRRIIPCPSF